MVEPPVDRREFLASASAAPVWPAAGGGLAAPAGGPVALIARETEPRNLETPFASLSGFITPTPAFYVRNHFPVPAIDPATFRLKVEGAVAQPLSLSLAELRDLPQVTRPITLECAGNGRVYLPKVRGVQWQQGAVGTANWTGVPLSAILERAKVRPEAVDVVLEGADAGPVENAPGNVPFARSLPLAKARRPEVLLALKMGGADLTPDHGFPVRAVVGGWYGMAAVKWLTRIIVTTETHTGYWQAVDYTYYERVNGLPVLRPLGEVPIKSQMARPTMGEVVPLGQPYRVFGAAWAGESDVAKVEISTDGGTHWHSAKLLGEAVPFCWRLWEWTWTPTQPGAVALRARATDSQGRSQPLTRDPDRRTYMITHVVPVDVVVQ
jgi:DMSO/TMAO reductase YedYZ molybdopterin-dependent catalytic subunit